MVTLFGNLGADPELMHTAGGPLLKMRLATTEVYYDKEKKRQERTEWHNVKMWGRRAEGLSKILAKGSRIFAKGRLETSSYEKDGDKRYKTEVVATDILLGGGRPNGMMTRSDSGADIATTDLPF